MREVQVSVTTAALPLHFWGQRHYPRHVDVALAVRPPTRISRFLHFARSPDDLIFADELKLMERLLPRFRCDSCAAGPRRVAAGRAGSAGLAQRF
jgi:hypothetical protein